jgi:hypothetical protein
VIAKAGTAALAALLLIPVLITVGVAGAISGILGSDTTGAAGLAGTTGTTSLICTAIDGHPTLTQTAGYRDDQLANAALIIAVGHQLGVPAPGQVIALATALQESDLTNLPHGDRDSLGLFQQRPSQGWGTPSQILNPTYATTQFYRHLLAIPGWQHLSLTAAAQAIQRSAFPNAYAHHAPAAHQLFAALAGASCATPPRRTNRNATLANPEPRLPNDAPHPTTPDRSPVPNPLDGTAEGSVHTDVAPIA